MKNSKRIISMMFSLILFLCIGTNVEASSLEDLGKVVDGSELLNTNKSTVTLENITKGNILNNGTASVANNGNGEVNVYGAVLGSVVCDKLVLKMTLQRYSDGAWRYVREFSDTKYNDSMLTKSYNVTVAKGYYYRVKAGCAAYKGSITETKMPITDGIWID